MTLVAALLTTAASAEALAREFRTADTQSETYPTVEALHYMGSLVAERSGGRHRAAVFHSRQLGEEKETLDPTRAGAIDLNRTHVALIGTMVPAMNALAMPFLFRSIGYMQKVTDFDRKPFEAAVAGIDAKAQRDPAIAQLIERIRKVE